MTIRIDLKRPVADRELAGPSDRPQGRLGRLLREPLLHFAVLGLILALAAHAYQVRHDLYRIEVTPARVADLSHKYALQFGAPPDPATLQQLVRDDIHDEVLFRQGLALKLDQDDEIVRRRVIQKEQFLLQNLTPPAEPTEAQLQAFYDAHPDRYVAASRATFSHIYFALPQDGRPDGDAATEARAKAALARIPKGATRAPDLGDPFPDIYDFSAFEPEQAQRLFGKTPLADAIYTAPVGRWSGPFKSAYGWHLLYVSARAATARQPLSEIKDRVRTDYLQAAQDKANAAAFQKIASRFTVVRSDGKPQP
ncbi:MAG: peptidyl-prolyl cis-trans isomerase [Proteobacteria bacterium]|nr:peptidyl-prolyl cis-trans isomerase [Pseudomonadota bacterium]